MYATYTMKRTQIYLDEDQDARLSKRAATSGTTKSALVREAIDAFLTGPNTDEIALNRFRAALDEVESRPILLPEGAQYVEALRLRDVVRRADLDARRSE